MSIYQFLLNIVKTDSPEVALREFKRLFFDYRSNPDNIGAFSELSFLIGENNRADFFDTLKRCCYILINNWESRRQYTWVYHLISSFLEIELQVNAFDKKIRRLHNWLSNFIESKDYQDLQLFLTKHDEAEIHKKLTSFSCNLKQNTRDDEPEKKHWSKRYTAYLLTSQYADASNSPEQREAARAVSQKLKEKFKFDLAMYTAHSQSTIGKTALTENPTGLGEDVLRLIKKILTKRGNFSYTNLANIFLKQTNDLTYLEFKENLQKYLIFSGEKQTIAEIIKVKLSRKIDSLYPKYNDEGWDENILLRTCNKIFSYLTTEDGKEPSEMFAFLMSQGNPITLVIVLLKLVLICPSSRIHLETRIAALIRYYLNFPESECQWVVNFFEIFNITFAIHADNDVQYNLIKISSRHRRRSPEEDPLDSYRIFSQHTGFSNRRWAEDDRPMLESYLSS